MTSRVTKINFAKDMAALSRSIARAEPSARFDHAAFDFGQNMLMYAGLIISDGTSVVPSSVVESFNVLTTAWQKPQQLRGQSLKISNMYGRTIMVAVSDGARKAYLFTPNNGLVYCVDLSSLQCQQISTESTTARYDGNFYIAMVCYRQKLVIYGGDNTLATSDEAVVFDLDTSEY